MEDKYTKEEARYIKIGLCVTAGIFLLLGLFLLNNKTMAHINGGEYYPLNAVFGRTDGLLVGDKVRLAGMTVGRVVDSKFDEKFHAVLTLEIKDDIKIPDDSSASIVSSGLMGPKYIEIEPGGSMDYIPVNGYFDYTQDAMVIEELIDRIISIGKANQSKKELARMEDLEDNI